MAVFQFVRRVFQSTGWFLPEGKATRVQWLRFVAVGQPLDRGVRYLRVQSMKRPAAAALLVLAGLTGCGSQYRPVINPINQTGPASQPAALVAIFSQPGLVPGTATSTTPPCLPFDTATGIPEAYASPGVVTVLDATGDSVSAEATLGNGPLTFGLDSAGANAYTENCDGTISSMTISGSLMTKNVATSTLLPGSAPINALVLTAGQYVVEQGHNAIAAMSGSPPTLKVEITGIAPSVINLTGVAAAARIYSISQGNSGTGGALAWGSCGTPSAVSVNGEADGIEVDSNSLSSRIPLGVCPVYGVTSADGNRAFILNRGSGTITVINAQSNQLDTVNPNNTPYVVNGTITLPCPSGETTCTPGPVHADFYTPGNLLVVSNYDDDTVSVIDTSLDVFGNDSATFGHVLATIPVGHQPAAVSVLQDGSRAYVANEGDGTVTVVSLTSFQPLTTISLTANGVTPQPRVIASNYNFPAGNVFVGAQNSPYVTVIRTDTDVVSAQVLVQGNVVDLRTTKQFAGQSSVNNIIDSRSVGSGVP
jgi:DNA-binding beta-propeller fold protein YncE